MEWTCWQFYYSAPLMPFSLGYFLRKGLSMLLFFFSSLQSRFVQVHLMIVSRVEFKPLLATHKTLG